MLYDFLLSTPETFVAPANMVARPIAFCDIEKNSAYNPLHMLLFSLLRLEIPQPFPPFINFCLTLLDSRFLKKIFLHALYKMIFRKLPKVGKGFA